MGEQEEARYCYWGSSGNDTNTMLSSSASSHINIVPTQVEPNFDVVITITNTELVDTSSPLDHPLDDDFYLLHESQNDNETRQNLVSDQLQALRDLVPGSQEKDHEPLLDDTAKYIKALQLQVELMSHWYDPGREANDVQDGMNSSRGSR